MLVCAGMREVMVEGWCEVRKIGSTSLGNGLHIGRYRGELVVQSTTFRSHGRDLWSGARRPR